MVSAHGKCEGINRRCKHIAVIRSANEWKKGVIMVDSSVFGLPDPSGIAETVMKMECAIWFSDAMAVDYASSLLPKLELSKGSEKKAVEAETLGTTFLYSFLIYSAYPKDKEFRRVVESNPEYSKNFKRIKQRLDSSNGELFLKQMTSAIEKEAKKMEKSQKKKPR